MKLVAIIDAGHGPNTAGKRCPDDSMREFHFNKPTAEYLGGYLLDEYYNVEVHYVHDVTGKRDVPLEERTEKANAIYAKFRNNPDVKVIYVSIHANAYGNGWNSISGIETFVHTSRSDEAVQLALHVQNQLIRTTGLTNRKVKYSDYWVLEKTAMTAILAECGFMTNREDAEKLKDDTYRRRVADAIKRGIAVQFNLKRKPMPTPVEEVNKMSVSDAQKRAAKRLVDLGITNGKDLDAAVTRGYLFDVVENLIEVLEGKRGEGVNIDYFANSEASDSQKRSAAHLRELGLSSGKGLEQPATIGYVLDLFENLVTGLTGGRDGLKVIVEDNRIILEKEDK
jgi:N-acetylmuramoyl-L-alanine amidase